MHTVDYRTRTIESELQLSLEAFGAVQIVGPKWCGKTTTSKQFAKSSIEVDRLCTSPGGAEKLALLPDSILSGEKPRLIDEWQLVPGIWDAVRRDVDRENASGLFILTGSSAVDSAKIMHSGAGRIGTIRMRTMSLHESGNSTGGISLLDLFQSVDKISDYTENGTEAIARLLVLGGWPGMFGKSDAAVRKIVEGYCDRISHGISERPGEFNLSSEKMAAIMTSLSRNVSTTASKASLLGDAASSGCTMSISSLDRYLSYLRRNYVIEDLPHWSPKLRTKTPVRTSYVHHFFDPAIAAMFLDATPADLLNDFETFGFLFESMVVRDIRSYAQAIGGKVYHYRDKDGLECDIIVHLDDGRWGAIEVKLGSDRGIEEGVRNLLVLRDKVNEQYRNKLSFLAIVVSTNIAYTRQDGIHVIPLACLRERWIPSRRIADVRTIGICNDSERTWRGQHIILRIQCILQFILNRGGLTEIRRDRYLERLIKRKNNGSVKVITGIRRCGKSYLLFKLFRDHLLSEGIPEGRIIGIALDDYANRDLRDPDILYSYVASRVRSADGPCHILLDEIQLVPGFEDLVNGLRHLDGVDIYITGSNSKFLSSDILTEFRGRGDEVRIRPLSFGEYRSAFPDKDTGDLWREYMVFGGMPELVVRSDEEQKMAYLDNLIKEVYLKDIEEHEGIRMPKELSSILDVLCSSVGSLTNPSKIQDMMATVSGIRMSPNTVSRYMDALCNSYLFEMAQRYDIKGRRILGSPAKFYAADVGLRNARLNFRQQESTHIMENVIYNELRSRGFNVDVGVVESRILVNGKQEYRRMEIDFVVNRADSRWYIQSAYGIPDDEKMDQEIRPFRRIPDSFRRILIVGDDVRPWHNNEGVLIVGIKDFLLDESLMLR